MFEILLYCIMFMGITIFKTISIIYILYHLIVLRDLNSKVWYPDRLSNPVWYVNKYVMAALIF